MLTKEFLQAVNDWQRGGDAKQKRKRGQTLKREAMNVPEEFRRCQLCCFRQLSIGEDSFWSLADQLKLPETISAWTTKPEVARAFKGGVPPPGLHGIIFVTCPQSNFVVLNLDRLYGNQEFNEAIERHKNDLDGYYKGIGRYHNSQHEVVLELDSILLTDVYEFGGFSSSREDLVKKFYGPNATEADYAEFDYLLKMSGQPLGAYWMGEDAKDRILSKIRRMMPAMRKIKKLQDASSSGNT
jgi:hypothetical protein